jgi:hypothetical protein
LPSGEHYSIADLHPTPVFDLCAGRGDSVS